MIVAILKEEDIQLSQKVEELFYKKYVFPYSPAHMEEVAVIYKKCHDFAKAKEHVKRHLDYISRISRNLEFLPRDEFKTNSRIEIEHPECCMGRVLKDYDITLNCEFIEEYFMHRRTRKEFEQFCQENRINGADRNNIITDDELQDKVNIKPTDKLSRITPEEIFKQKKIKEISNIRLQTEGRMYEFLFELSSLEQIPKYCDIKDNHPMKEEIVNFLIKTLHAAGYYAEHIEKSRSFMHDITHAIYAMLSDFFVNDDFASRQKIKAVYHFLEVPCQVLSKPEFIRKQFSNLE